MSAPDRRGENCARREMNAMEMKSFLAAMGAGIAVGALGAMMLPKSSTVYQMTNDAAKTIRREAEKAVDSITSSM